MWIALALLSALCLGFYDVMKKLSVRANNVLMVLMLNTLFSTLIMSPVIICGIIDGSFGFGGMVGHLHIILKAMIVLGSWICGYFAIKHLPLTIQGPINASRPVLVLVGAVLIFGEQLNWVQWCGILLGFGSLYMISRIGTGEGFSFSSSRWLWMSIAAAAMGAISALYDKYLLQFYQPLDVQAWYTLYQCVLMTATILIIQRFSSRSTPKFVWRWSIIFISVFLTVADIAYFYALSLDGAMIAVVAMIRRGSVLVPFLYGVFILRENHVRAKVIDLMVLMLSLALLVVGSTF